MSEQKIEAEELLFGKLVKGGVVKLSLDKEADKLAFAFKEASGPARPATPDEPDALKSPNTWSRGIILWLSAERPPPGGLFVGMAASRSRVLRDAMLRIAPQDEEKWENGIIV